jgi:uncharacterized protein (UPF0147 family)
VTCLTTASKFTEEQEKAFKSVEVLLKGMLGDRSVPRNIKRIAQRGINLINEATETPGMIAANIIYLVDDLTLDPNIPFATRTTVYRIISLLEKIRDE